jgi:hypothetical protein
LEVHTFVLKIERSKPMEEEKKYKCQYCGKEKDAPDIICICEVEDTGFDNFWK